MWRASSLVNFLLQASVVVLGFGMNLKDIERAGQLWLRLHSGQHRCGELLGLGLGYLMQVTRKPASLMSAGTAICGGSAIAAVGPIAGVNEQEMAVSLGAAFILNSVALLLFPLIGYAGALHSWGGLS